MARFNRGTARATTDSPVTTEAQPTGRTYEGAPGYIRDARSELFLLAVSNMVGEDTFYEKAGDRDERFRALVHQVAVEDGDWLACFLPWLRGEANMRSAPVVAALEAVRARLAAGLHGGNRELVASVLQRADEPGEALAYWTSRHGRAIPKPVKRGIADAVQRLYTERSLAKYDSNARGFRFGDVIDLVHPTPAGDRPWQGDLFAHALDRRHGRDKPIPQSLRVLRDRAELLSIPVGERRSVLADPRRLAAAGITWEALAGWLQGPMDAQAWAAVIPSMGYMALLRNLRNFDEAGIGDELAGQIIAKLTNPEEVARSRQLPFRFYSAYRTAPSLRWGHALDTALTLAARNVPSFRGRTLVLVDTSASMSSGAVSARSTVTPVQAAALFGVAVAARGDQVDLVGFANGTFRHEIRPGASVLREVDRFCGRIGEVGHGTQIADALRSSWKGHDRAVILSDMQTMTGHYANGVTTAVPSHVPLYGFNLVGYKAAAMPTGSGNRHEFGGFSDACFRLIPLLEAGRHAGWPF
ncbi:TROVE domain-containing protein [Microbispora rosea]|uniref:TROVE domain-containing protein n=1 Tax=Microbispora rosea TaxID=58117 RepID=A0A1N7H4P5_9ACTN|nr:TROVE domain-containing protein [Microbispora rosea]GIH51701.1 RNA-binding protein [Microbispora rosea subsp. rosea]SIS19809.1 TROVE domain-containing protein [Microbispora rosea]